MTAVYVSWSLIYHKKCKLLNAKCPVSELAAKSSNDDFIYYELEKTPVKPSEKKGVCTHHVMNKLNQDKIDKCASRTTSYECMRDLVIKGKACADNKIGTTRKATLDVCQDLCEESHSCKMISISPGEGM